MSTLDNYIPMYYFSPEFFYFAGGNSS